MTTVTREQFEEAKALSAAYLEVVDDYVSQLEAQVPRWIPVEEALPEDGLNRLWLDVAGDIFLAAYNPLTERIVESANTCCAVDAVTHWMPLPEAPEAK